MRIEQDLDLSDYIMYLSNAGVMVKIKDRKILIDAFCNSDIPIFKGTPDYILENLINDTYPFGNVDIMLITHHHSDHFDIKSICRYVKQNQNVVIVSTPEVISQLREAEGAIEANRLIEFNINQGGLERISIKDLDIQVISMLHEGKELMRMHNYAYLVEYKGKSVLHLGDTAPVLENFENLCLKQYEIDLMIANFPYISIPSARKIIQEYICPKRLAIVHMPNNELDRFGWIKTTKKNYEKIKYDFTSTIFLEDIGKVFQL